MTPVELNIYARTVRDNKLDEQRTTQANNYMLATMIRGMIWGKQAPSYDECFPDEKKQEMDDEQMYAVVRGLNAMFGGKEE